MLRKLPAFILCCTICGILTSQAAAVGAPPVGEAHVYKKVDDRELKLYVTKPADWKKGDSRPAIVFFHGGGWTGGSPGQFTEHSKYLVTRGMVCVQVQYRLLDKKKSELRLEAARRAGIWPLLSAWSKAPTIRPTTQRSRQSLTPCACSIRFSTTVPEPGEQNASAIVSRSSRRFTT